MYLSKFLNIKFVDNLYSLDSFPAIDFNCVFAYCSSISANESAQFFSSGVNNNLFFVGCSSQTGTSTVANGAFNTQGFRLRRESVNLLDKVGEDGMLRFINETARTITIELTSKSTAGGFTYYTYIANNNTLSDPHVVSGTGSRSLTLVIPPNGCFGMTSTDIQNAVETLTYY